MKRIIIATVFCGLSGIYSGVFADVSLQSNADVQGSWTLDYTKKNATTAETIKREDNWSFSEGKVTIKHIPREGTYYDQSPVGFEVEGGKLKIGLLGRPDKFDVFSMLEKDDKTMVLKGKFGDIYHFSKK
ncbi:hypothetical protein [Methylomonas sp. AM2-LC]|uniref:hypothetical protein n=1 Tax=Methylomonas sp. AM2-LC TaxID=3153301 RepID=UPI00326313DF